MIQQAKLFIVHGDATIRGSQEADIAHAIGDDIKQLGRGDLIAYFPQQMDWDGQLFLIHSLSPLRLRKL